MAVTLPEAIVGANPEAMPDALPKVATRSNLAFVLLSAHDELAIARMRWL